MSPDWKAVQLGHHEVRHIVGIALHANGIQIPTPTGVRILKSNQSLVDQDVNKLNGEKRIAGSLLAYELRQRHRTSRITMQRICNQACQVIGAQRLQMNLPDCSPGLPN